MIGRDTHGVVEGSLAIEQAQCPTPLEYVPPIVGPQILIWSLISKWNTELGREQYSNDASTILTKVRKANPWI